MSERYKKIYSLEKYLYQEFAPVIIKAGALVSDTEKGKLHIQLKFQNLDDKAITLLKAKVILMDSIGRPLNEIEKQYLDLNAKCSEEFGANVPISVTENAARQFSAIVMEVCFADGTVWSANDMEWEEVPSQEALSEKFTSPEALKEFELSCCEKAKYIPLSHKDIWMCSCGNINKSNKGQCCCCDASLENMLAADNEELRLEYIYRQANRLTDTTNSADMAKGVALFESIIDWKDSKERLEESKTRLEDVLKIEKAKAKKKKKLVITVGSILLAAILAVTGSIIVVNAIRSKGIKFELEGDYYVVVGGNDDDVKRLVIPETYNGKPVKKIADKAFEYYWDLETIELPDSITAIGNNAFNCCEKLKEITIPNSVTTIGEYAFASLDSITSIVIPDSVTTIGEWAIYACENLQSVTLGKGMTYIPGCMFYGCSKLQNITIHDKITTIGGMAFNACSSLEKIVIPDSVNVIEYSVFSGCDDLTIYCEATEKGKNWSYSWAGDCPVVLGYIDN